MGHSLVCGDPAVDIVIRRSAQAKRLILRVCAPDGQVRLTLPTHVPEAEGRRFAESRMGWVRAQIARQGIAIEVTIGSTIPWRGTTLRVFRSFDKRIAHNEGQLYVPGPPAQAGARVAAWLRIEARAYLTQAAERYAGMLGHGYTKLALRDPRTRWGSCSHAGRLMFSWRLVMAPPDVLDYVAAHEVAHLAHMNHAPEFWAALRALHGPYRAQRDWLRDHGAQLHRYRFTP